MDNDAKLCNISELRANVAAKIIEVNRTGTPISIVKRKKVEAVIFPDEFKEIATAEVNLSKWIPLMFARKFLYNAPSHLIDAQIKEFEQVDYKNLWILSEINTLPVKKGLRQKVIEKIGETILLRLEKRNKIARAISEADKENLYEAAEHMTGELDLK